MRLNMLRTWTVTFFILRLFSLVLVITVSEYYYSYEQIGCSEVIDKLISKIWRVDSKWSSAVTMVSIFTFFSSTNFSFSDVGAAIFPPRRQNPAGAIRATCHCNQSYHSSKTILIMKFLETKVIVRNNIFLWVYPIFYEFYRIFYGPPAFSYEFYRISMVYHIFYEFYRISMVYRIFYEFYRIFYGLPAFSMSFIAFLWFTAFSMSFIAFLWVYRRNEPTWDIGKTREKFVNL